MNELLFEKQSEWSQAEEPSETIKGYAEELGLDSSAFNDCLDSGETEVIVQGDGLAGQTLGVNATPYFFVNDLPIRGGLSIDRLGQIIDYVRQLSELDLSGLEATSHAVALRNVLRPDEPVPGLTQEEATMNGPHVERGQFVVPKIG